VGKPRHKKTASCFATRCILASGNYKALLLLANIIIYALSNDYQQK